MASKNRRKHARYVDHIAESGPVEKFKPAHHHTPEDLEQIKDAWERLSLAERLQVGEFEDYDWEHPIERVMPEPEIEGGEVQPPVTEEG